MEKTGTTVNVSGGDNKKLYMILGIVVVAGIAMFMMRKPKEEVIPAGSMRLGDEDMEDIDIDDIDIDDIVDEEEEQEEVISYGNKLGISNASGMGKYKWFSADDNEKADAALEIGTSGMVNGTTPCTISNFWINSKGQKAAFQCEEIDYYDIPNGSRFEW